MASGESGFFYRFGGILKVIGVLLLITLCLTGFYLLTYLGPGKVADRRQIAREVPAEAEEWRTKSGELEARFREVLGLRSANEQDLALLQEAIQLQRQYLQALGGIDRASTDRLNQLEILLHTESVRPLAQRSREIERDALAARDAGNADEALRLMREVEGLERRIHDDFSKAENRNAVRFREIERRVHEMEARPFYQQTLAEEEEALQAVETGDWAKARHHYEEAIRLQRHLNMEYRGLRYADAQRLSRLEADYFSLESSPLFDEIQTLLARAEEHFEQARYREAAADFQSASRLQRRLNEQFPRSRFASVPKVDELLAKSRSSLSRELGEEILSKGDELNQRLLQREIWQAITLINQLFPMSERFRETYGATALLDERFFRRIQYLHFVQEDLDLLQDRIYGQLIPLPGQTEQFMYRVEVPQALYSSVMLNNPSRQQGERLPVDSVTWSEAKEFCDKVSWILGRPVRLPTLAEFYEALGSLRYVNLDEVSWNLENSSNRTHEVGTKQANEAGFHDLLGNVAEWLEAESLTSDLEVPLAGGSAETSIDRLAESPLENLDRRTRNRMIGFRFVVDMSEGTEAN